MNADSYFIIGDAHSICEDYALSGVEDTGAYAMICDGCSESPQVDIGARLLAMSAKRTLYVGGDKLTNQLFGKVTIRNLEHIGKTIPLHPQALDATLLATWVTGNKFTVHIFGDGVFVHKTATTLRIVHVEFESDAPAYLSYYLEPERLKGYSKKFAGSKRIVDISMYTGPDSDINRDTIENETYVEPFAAVTFTGLVEKGDMLAVTSDGVNSFRKENSEKIEWFDIIREFVNFKSFEGVFVQRRLGAMKRKFVKQKIGHYDDISMAAIVV